MSLRLLPALILLAACGEPEPATFTEVRDDVLVKSCGLSSCHGAGTGDLTIDPADPDAIYANLVDVASSAKPEMVLVKPSDPDNSYLIWKLEGHAEIVDDPMPPPGGLLASDPDTVDRIRSWIADGAQDN